MKYQKKSARIAWLLIAVGLLVFALVNLPQARIKQTLLIRVNKAANWLSDLDQQRIKSTGLESCDITLEIESPRTLQVGRAGQISMTAYMKCPANEVLSEANSIRMKLVEDQYQVLPQGEIRRPLRPDQNEYTDWVVLADDKSRFDGTLWVYLDLQDEQGSLSLPLASIQLSSAITSILGMRHATVVKVSMGLILAGIAWLILNGWMKAYQRKKSSSIRPAADHQN